MTYNGLRLGAMHLPDAIERWPILGKLVRVNGAEDMMYPWYVTAACALFAMALLKWFHHLPYRATKEERLTDDEDDRQKDPQHPDDRPGDEIRHTIEHGSVGVILQVARPRNRLGRIVGHDPPPSRLIQPRHLNSTNRSPDAVPQVTALL